MTKLTAEWFGSMTQCESTYSIINNFRKTGKQKTKGTLPVCSFQAMFDTSFNKEGKEGTWRVNLHSYLTGMVMVDIDHVEGDPQVIIDQWLAREDFKELGILLIYITPSGKGIKMVFIARKEWGNLIDNQYEMASLLGVKAKVDGGCKDASRASFIPKGDDVKYLDNRLFTYFDPAYDEQYGPLYRRKSAKTGPTKKKWRDYEKLVREEKRAEKARKAAEAEAAKVENSAVVDPTKAEKSAVAETKAQNCAVAESSGCSAMYHNVAYSKIATELTNELGEPEKGDRHKTMMQMGNMLSVICDNDPKLLTAIMQGLPFVKTIVEERGIQEVERAMNYITENSTYIYRTRFQRIVRHPATCRVG